MRLNPVKLKIYQAGLTMAEIAREGGFDRSVVMKTVDLKRFNPDVQDYIARLLNEPGESIFGEHYWRRRAS